jgi:hypothetical protein
MKLKDSHMQRYLDGERLFVGWNIEVFNGDNLFIHGPTSITAHMLIDAMDQHPYTTSGDPLQQKVSLYAK